MHRDLPCLAHDYRPQLVLAPTVPRVLALRDLSQLCTCETQS
jgi:hypothetical protein